MLSNQMDCYLVDILWLSEAFAGAKTVNFGIKPTAGTTLFAYLGKGDKFQIDQGVKAREKDEK